MDVSIVVVTYNPDYKKLFSTLKSIICQKYVDFEVIIADDGSVNFSRSKVETWFFENNFENYSFVLNSTNRGTMRNAYSGWNMAKGKYIKQLSPGDMLFNSTVLYDSIQYIEKKKYDIAFGLAVSYYSENDEIKLRKLQQPQNLIPYYNECMNEIKKMYVALRDYANGMAFIAKKDLLLKYGKMLLDKVIYAEDCVYILMVADDVKIGLIQDYIIWYESGTGISTSGSKIWAKRIYDDNIRCYEVIASIRPEWKSARIAIGKVNANLMEKLICRIYRFIYRSNIRKSISKDQCDCNFDKKINNKEYLMFLLS